VTAQRDNVAQASAPETSERDWKPNLNFRGVLDFSIKLQVVEGTATNHTF